MNELSTEAPEGRAFFIVVDALIGITILMGAISVAVMCIAAVSF